MPWTDLSLCNEDINASGAATMLEVNNIQSAKNISWLLIPPCLFVALNGPDVKVRIRWMPPLFHRAIDPLKVVPPCPRWAGHNTTKSSATRQPEHHSRLSDSQGSTTQVCHPLVSSANLVESLKFRGHATFLDKDCVEAQGAKRGFVKKCCMTPEPIKRYRVQLPART